MEGWIMGRYGEGHIHSEDQWNTLMNTYVPQKQKKKFLITFKEQAVSCSHTVRELE